MADFTAAIAQAVKESPMVNGSQGMTHPGRVLLADGDGLAYYCAGNDGTDPGQARWNLINKLDEAMRASGSERALVAG